MHVLVCLVVLGVATTLMPARAGAEPDKAAVKLAKQYVDAGLAAQNARDYDTAITLYDKAYELVPHPLLLFNLAQAHRLAGRGDKALALYERYLAEDPQGDQAQIARDLVAELRAEAERKEAAAREAAERKAAGGDLIVLARSRSGGAIASGTVMIDDEPRGELADGRLHVRRLAEGRHTVAVEAGGYQRFEQKAIVRAGERATVEAELVAVAPRERSRAWKWTLGASAGITVAGIAFAYYAHGRVSANADELRSPPGGSAITESDCGKSDAQLDAENLGAFRRACTWHTRFYMGAIVSSVAAAAALVSLIMLYREPEPEPEPGARSRGKKREVAIAPIMLSGGAAASVSVTW